MSTNATATAPESTNSTGDSPLEEARNAALEDAEEMARRLGLRDPTEEPAETRLQMAAANPGLAGRLSRWPDLILSAHDGQNKIHFVAVMTPTAPGMQDVRNVRLAANLLRLSTGRPAHAVIVELREGPEPEKESWNPVHWHTITKKAPMGTNDRSEKQE